MRKDFNLRDIVNKAMDQATPADAPEIVEHVPVAKITPNARNIYGMRDLDELAASIELTGLLHPIILRPNPDGDGYTIVDGERRFRAMSEVLGHDAVPAIIRTPDAAKTDAVNAILEELALLEANRQTRKTNPAELSKEAERYKELLIQLKENGVEIPGRLRDVLAQALDISASKLARLQKIRGSLVPEYLAVFDAGDMSESVAYTIAQLDPDIQRLVVESEKDAKKLAAYEVTERAEYLAACTARRDCPHGAVCTWGVKMYDIGKNKSAYMKCTNTSGSSPCCHDCTRAAECNSVCPLARKDVEYAKQKKLDEAAKAKKEQAEQRKAARKDWARVAKIREAAGFAADDERLPKLNGYTWAEFEKGEIKGAQGMDDFIHAVFLIGKAITIADLFGVTLDELVGRTVPQAAPPEAPDDE